jgi:hypothetical protein
MTVKGRGMCSKPHWRYVMEYQGEDSFRIRVDDKRNPEFWMEVEFDAKDIANAIVQHFLDLADHKAPEA